MSDQTIVQSFLIMATESPFIILAACPSENFQQVYKINQREYVATDYADYYKFNVDSNRWSHMFTVNDIEISCCYAACYDHCTNSLIYQSSVSGMLTSRDMEHGAVEFHYQIDFQASFMVVIGDELHIFGTRSNVSQVHRVVRTASWEMITETSMQDDYGLFIHCDYSAPRNSIIKSCWSEGVLQEYSLRSYQWMSLDWSRSVVNSLSDTAMVFTFDGRYAFYFGGRRHSYARSKKITIFDFKKQRAIESKIKCPEKGDYRAVMLVDTKRDELTSFGFIRSTFKKHAFRNVQPLPTYLMEMFTKWYSNEQVYLLKYSNMGRDTKVGAQWKISVADIFR